MTTLADPAALEDSSWELVDGIEVPDLAGSAPTIEFDGGSLSGNGGCNRYHAAYEVDGSNISIGDVMSTMMGCEPPIAELEQQFFDALAEVDEWRIEDEQLILAGSSEDLRFQARPKKASGKS